jgi:hypothetical protein
MLFVERRPAEVEFRYGLYRAHAVCTEVVVTLELSPRKLLVPPPEEYRPRWPMVTVYPLLFPYEARHFEDLRIGEAVPARKDLFLSSV